MKVNSLEILLDVSTQLRIKTSKTIATAFNIYWRSQIGGAGWRFAHHWCSQPDSPYKRDRQKAHRRVHNKSWTSSWAIFPRGGRGNPQICTDDQLELLRVIAALPESTRALRYAPDLQSPHHKISDVLHCLSCPQEGFSHRAPDIEQSFLKCTWV